MNYDPGALETIENNFQIIGCEELDYQRAQAALKRKRNSSISPIYMLPSESLAYIFMTAAIRAEPLDHSSDEYARRSLSRVSCHWRRIALEVCPAWRQLTLTLEIDHTLEDKNLKATIGLCGGPKKYIQVPIHRRPGLGEDLYIRETLDTIAPYIKHFNYVNLASKSIENLRPFLELWIEEGTPGSIVEFNLSVNEPALVFPEMNSSRFSERLNQYLTQTKYLSLSSVALDWSSIAFDTLTSMSISNLPTSYSPTLAQLARVLSTCPRLRHLSLERITILPSLDAPALELVEFEELKMLSLKQVNVSRALSIISPGFHGLILTLEGVIDDDDTLESLQFFTSRANIRHLNLTLPETRSDEALARLLHYVTRPLMDLEILKLAGMNLREPELNGLAVHFSVPDNAIALVDTAARSLRTGYRYLSLSHCTIHTSPLVLSRALSALFWIELRLNSCNYVLITSEGVNADAELISGISEFGVRLNELLPGRVKYF